MSCVWKHCNEGPAPETANWQVGQLCPRHFQMLWDEYAHDTLSGGLVADLIKIRVLLQLNVPKCIELMKIFNQQMHAAAIMPGNLYTTLVGKDPRFAKSTGEDINYLKLSRALEYFEGYCWFPANRVLLGGLLTDAAFHAATASGFNKDPGAGIRHGEQTHRVQWHVVMREITADFTKPFSQIGGWRHSPLELYWAMTHTPAGMGDRNFWAKTLDHGSNEGWGNPDRVLDDVRKASQTLAALAVERRLDKRSSIAVNRVQMATPVVNSERVRKLIFSMHAGDRADYFRRLRLRHVFTPLQQIHADKLDSYFETHVLETIYVMEKVGFPMAPAPNSLEHFAKRVYDEASKLAPELFRTVYAAGSYEVVNDLPVKINRPDNGVGIDAARIASSRNAFNNACYRYLANCGAYPVQANRW